MLGLSYMLSLKEKNLEVGRRVWTQWQRRYTNKWQYLFEFQRVFISKEMKVEKLQKDQFGLLLVLG